MNIYIHSYIPSLSFYYKEGRKEYEKRLSRYCKIKFSHYKNEKQLEKATQKLKSLPFDSGKEALIFVTSGKEESIVDSPGLAVYIESKGVQGVSNLHFIVGFPTDSFPSSLPQADTLSVSKMDLSADLLSFVLEEQIYRAYRIINKEPYHK